MPLHHVEDKRRPGAKRLTSPERFEIKQLIASGAVSAADVSLLHLMMTTCIDGSTPT